MPIQLNKSTIRIKDDEGNWVDTGSIGMEMTQVDAELDAESANPVENRVIAEKFEEFAEMLEEVKEDADDKGLDVSGEGSLVRVDDCLGGASFNKITVVGKNLFTPVFGYALTGNETNGYSLVANSLGISYIAKVEPNTTYTVTKFSNGDRFRIIGFNELPSTTTDATARVIRYSNDLTRYEFSTTFPYIAFTENTNGTDIQPMSQLELGSVENAEYEAPIVDKKLELTVSGENLFEPYKNYSAYGGVSSGYRIRSNENSYCFVSKIDNNTDYAIRSYSDGNRMIVILFKEYPISSTPLKEYDRVVWKTDSAITEEDKTVIFNSRDYNYATLTIAANDPNIDTIIKKGYLGYSLPATYSIVPNTNPYTVPFDIAQNDGTNVVSIEGASVKVEAVKGNSTIKTIMKADTALIAKSAYSNIVVVDGLQGGVPFNNITISGTNLISFPYVMSNTDPYAQTFPISTINSVATCNDNGTVTFVADPTTERGNFYPFFICGTNGERYISLKNKRYYVYIESEGNLEIGLQCVYYKNGSQVTVEYTYGKIIDNSEGKYDSVRINPWISTGHPVEAGIHYEVTTKFMFVEGAEKVDYVSPLSGLTLTANGVDYSITPTVIPYTIPQNIIQTEGKNTLSITGVGNPVLYVEGNKTNSQLAKVYDAIDKSYENTLTEIDRHTPQLLFSGVTSADSPAVVDLSGYEMIKILIKSSTSNPLDFWCGTIDYAVSWITDDNVLLGVSQGKSEQFSIYISNSGIYTLSSNDYINIYGINQHTELKIYSQPEDVTAAVGETTVFSVGAQGDGLTYQWEYSNNNGRSWAICGLTGNQTAKLSVPVVAGRHNNRYRCVMTDVYGNTVTSDGATLTVIE